MGQVTVSLDINASVATVFGVVTDIERLPESNAGVVAVEFLGERRSGQGTRFRETRSSNGRTMVTELELTECVANERARFVSDMGGTVWDTVFSFQPLAGQGAAGTHLEIRLDARPHRLLARLMTPLIMGKVRRGMGDHIGALKAYCESLDKP